MPQDGRETSCYLVRSGCSALLLDAGTGLRRLVTDPSLLDGVERLDVVLSHFHMDHVVGLGYLDALHPLEVAVWGPGAALYGSSTRSILASALAPPTLHASVLDACEVRDFALGANEVAVGTLSARPQLLHTSPSAAFRLGDDLVYATDTEPDEGTALFAAGSRLLLHEAWAASGDWLGHSSALSAARIASAAGVESLLLTHLPPTRSASEILASARTVFPAALAEDGLSFDL